MVISACPWQVGSAKGNALLCYLETPLVPTLGLHWTKQVADSYCSPQRAKWITRLCPRVPSAGWKDCYPETAYLLVIRKSWSKKTSACIDWVIFLSGNAQEKTPKGEHNRRTVGRWQRLYTVNVHRDRWAWTWRRRAWPAAADSDKRATSVSSVSPLLLLWQLSLAGSHLP